MRPDTPLGGSALDAACGPGHFTLSLAEHLGYARVTGLDLAEAMITKARTHALEANLHDRVRFGVGDATNLREIPDASHDLTTCTDALHHLPDLSAVQCVLRELDRVTKPEGLIVAMDLVRLHTARLTERYVEQLGNDYRTRGLSNFLADFHHSMYAAWTPSELRTAMPPASGRWWCQLVPYGLPTIQLIVGLPVGRRRLFLRTGFPPQAHPLWRAWLPRLHQELGRSWADRTRAEWRLMRMGLWHGMRHCVPPRSSVNMNAA